MNADLVVVLARAAAVLLMLGLIHWHPPVSAADELELPPAVAARLNASQQVLGHQFVDNTRCERCHQAPVKEDLDRQMKGQGPLFRISLTEYPKWYESKHRQAGDALSGLKAKAMARQLKYPDDDCRKVVACLNCHTDSHSMATPNDPAAGTKGAENNARPDDINAVQDNVSQEQVISAGVACQACHGAASDWVCEHDKSGWWRRSPTEKQSLGMVNVRDTVTRAELCLSCHLGSIRAGKLVTHEMYAAGHPPLRSFEVEAFDRAITHGRPLGEKLPETLQSLGIQKDDLHASRSVLLSDLVALRESAQLLADASDGLKSQREPDTDAPGERRGESAWPEFALFDCAACHHELRLPARRAHASVGTPGRPMFRYWPLALAQVSIDEPDLSGDLRPLTQALSRRPFGERHEVAEAAKLTVALLNRQIAALKSTPQWPDRTVSLNALRRICEAGLANQSDFDTAQELSRGFQQIFAEIAGTEGAPPAAGALDATTIEQIRAILKKLEQELNLTIHGAARDKGVDEAVSTASFKYQPDVFQKNLSELLQKLPPPQR